MVACSMVIDTASVAVLVNSDFRKCMWGQLTGYLFIEGWVNHRSICTAWLVNAAQSSDLTHSVPCSLSCFLGVEFL